MARRRHNTRNSDPTPGWIWMLFGLGLGLLVAIGVYLRVPGSPSVASSTSQRAETPRPPQEKKERPAPKPVATEPPPADEEDKRFQFYDILPQFEVVVPRQDARAAPRAQHAPPVQQPGRYLLQAGSFNAAPEADRLQATLALRGIESRVQQATVDGTVFYRVQIGPIDDLDTLNRTRRQLLDAGIEPLPLKLRD
jgi:cell division protein FtsN